MRRPRGDGQDERDDVGASAHPRETMPPAAADPLDALLDWAGARLDTLLAEAMQGRPATGAAASAGNGAAGNGAAGNDAAGNGAAGNDAAGENGDGADKS